MPPALSLIGTNPLNPGGTQTAGVMNPDLLGHLIDRHAAALELYARQWCDSPEDVVQEAFVKLAGQRPVPDQPVAWLFRAVRNGALNAATANRRRKRHEAKAAASAPPWFEPDLQSPGGSDLDSEQAHHALTALPLEQREVIVAHLWGELSFSEIATLVGSSTSSVHRRYQAGLVSLRENLGVSCRHSLHTSPTERTKG